MPEERLSSPFPTDPPGQVDPPHPRHPTRTNQVSKHHPPLLPKTQETLYLQFSRGLHPDLRYSHHSKPPNSTLMDLHWNSPTVGPQSPAPPTLLGPGTVRSYTLPSGVSVPHPGTLLRPYPSLRSTRLVSSVLHHVGAWGLSGSLTSGYGRRQATWSLLTSLYKDFRLE